MTDFGRKAAVRHVGICPYANNTSGIGGLLGGGGAVENSYRNLTLPLLSYVPSAATRISLLRHRTNG